MRGGVRLYKKGVLYKRDTYTKGGREGGREREKERKKEKKKERERAK